MDQRVRLPRPVRETPNQRRASARMAFLLFFCTKFSTAITPVAFVREECGSWERVTVLRRVRVAAFLVIGVEIPEGA